MATTTTTTEAKQLARSLETPRLKMRLYDDSTTADASFIVKLLTNPEVIRLMGDMHVTAPEAVAPLAALWALNPAVSNGYSGFGMWMVQEAGSSSSGETIGFMSLRQVKRIPDLGYGFLPEYWGKGYATEAATELFRYVTREMGLPTVIAYTPKGHEASQNVLLKVGFQRTQEEFKKEGELGEKEKEIEEGEGKIEMFVYRNEN